MQNDSWIWKLAQLAVILMGAVIIAFLAYAQTKFDDRYVLKEQYKLDQHRIERKLDEIQLDIRQLLKEKK